MSRSKKNANRDLRAAVATHNICHLDGRSAATSESSKASAHPTLLQL